MLFVASPVFAAPDLSGNSAITPSLQSFEKEDFSRIAANGFNDPMNNYAFSMTEFNGDVYVGTNRNFLCQIFEVLKEVDVIPDEYEFTQFTCASGEPWSYERAQDMCAEIWRYHDAEWELVYRSIPVFLPGYLGLPGLPGNGGWVAKEPGFRNMITFTDRWGEEAIYAASGISMVPGRLLLKSTDGTTWDPVATPLEMSSDSRSMAVHNGKLYVGPNRYMPDASIWTADDPIITGDGSNWQKVADFTGEEPGENVCVTSMASFNGYLYAGTQNDEAGFQVWRSDAKSPDYPGPGQWTKIIEYGAGDMASTRALTMKVFKGQLYVGSSMFPLSVESPYILDFKGFELIRIDSGDSWELLVGDYLATMPPPGDGELRIPSSGWPGGFANFFNLYCWSLQEHGGVLYLGSFDMSSFLQFLPMEEIIEQPAFDEFFEAMEDNKEGIVIGLTELIAGLEETGMNEEFIGPLRQLKEAFEQEPIDWEQVWQIYSDRYVGADLWKTEDGIFWDPVTLNGFDNPDNYGFRTMIEGSLYVGTANPFQGCEVWRTPYIPVGGEVYPMNKVSVLTPWILVGMLLATVISWYVLIRRKTQS